jgi:nitroreductase
MQSTILEAIHRRRSIREYTDQEVSSEQLRTIVEAGTWAPSGLNNQPWRFVIVRDPGTRCALAAQTTYRHIV